MKTANYRENRRLLNSRDIFVFMCVNMVEEEEVCGLRKGEVWVRRR